MPITPPDGTDPPGLIGAGQSEPPHTGDAAPSTIEKAEGLWARVKEHKILQWGLGYLGAALALAHGQELLAETYEWPHSIARLLMGALILGFPIVLTFAWYQGHKGLKRFSAAEMTIVALLLVICSGGFFLFVHSPEQRPDARQPAAIQVAAAASSQGSTPLHQVSAATEAGVSLAVLPFVNMSDDKSQEYFSDGLSEELLNQLAQIKNLRVAGRTSSFAFKGKNEDLRVIAQALGVNHLLEGSVRKSGDQLRITAQLINGTDGSHLWSQSYDRELKDVFKVQEDIAKDVASAMSITLGVGETARPEGGTSNLDAYDKYLRANALVDLQGPNELSQAIGLFREAVALDPNFALAWLGLYSAQRDSLVYLPQNAEQTRREMNEARARINALSPDAWWARALSAGQFDQQHKWAEAEAEASAAVASAPASQTEGVAAYTAVLMDVGRFREAYDTYWLRLVRADPLATVVSSGTQLWLDSLGRFSEAQAEYERSRTLAGDQEVGDIFAVPRALALKGRAAAKAQMERFIAHQSVPMPVFNDVLAVFDDPKAASAKLRAAFTDPANHDETRQLKIAFWASFFGDTELGNKALRVFAVDLNGGRLRVIWHPVFAPVRKTQGFKDLMRDLGFYDYWRKSGKWGDFCHPVGADDFECR